jgi:hypothetical protein
MPPQQADRLLDLFDDAFRFSTHSNHSQFFVERHAAQDLSAMS